MNLPDNILEDGCPDPSSSCASLGDPTDPSNPPQSLVIKPETITLCAAGSVQFTTYLESQAGQVLLTAGVTYTSSNPSVLTINPTSGVANPIGAGIVTVTATWQNLIAVSQVNVLLGVDCCSNINVGTFLLIDISRSMTKQFNATYARKIDAAKAIASAIVETINPLKDQMGLIQFALSSQIVEQLTNDATLLKDDISHLGGGVISGLDIPNTNIPAAVQLAVSALGQCLTCDQKVIVIISDGMNRPKLSTSAYADLLASAESFKSSGGIIISVGVRAAADGFTLLQQLASGGFFINLFGSGSNVVTDGVSELFNLMSYYCGYHNYGTSDNPAAVPDNNAPADNEGGNIIPPGQLPLPSFLPASGTDVHIGQNYNISPFIPGHPHAKFRYTINAPIQNPSGLVNGGIGYWFNVTNNSAEPNNPQFDLPSDPSTGIDYDGNYAPITIRIDPAAVIGTRVKVKIIGREAGFLDSAIAEAFYTVRA